MHTFSFHHIDLFFYSNFSKIISNSKTKIGRQFLFSQKFKLQIKIEFKRILSKKVK